MEKFTVTAPQSLEFTVHHVLLDWGAKVVQVAWSDTLGSNHVKQWTPGTTPTGQTLIVGLNKANLSIKSLHKRIFEQLVADGAITLAGSVTGTPD